MARQQAKAYRSRAVVEAADAARGETDAANVASTIRTDAVTAGLVHGGDRYKNTARASSRRKARQTKQRRNAPADAGHKDQILQPKTSRRLICASVLCRGASQRC